MTPDQVAELMNHAAAAVCEVLSEANVNAETIAFSLVLWPAGTPELCSVVTASGHLDAETQIGFNAVYSDR